MYALLVGMTFVDESHQAMDPEAKPTQLAHIHRHIRAREMGSDIWHITATPCAAKFEDVMSAVALLASQLANDMATLRWVYQRAISSGTTHFQIAFEEHFLSIFNERLLIRDVEDSTFLGRPITNAQLVRPRIFSTVTPDAQKKAVQAYIEPELRERLQAHLCPDDPFVNYLQAIQAARITNVLYFLSLFPSVAESMRLGTLPEAIYQDSRLSELIRSLPNTTGEAISGCKTLTDAVEKFARGPKSPKVQCILNSILLMLRDSSERADPNKELTRRFSGRTTRVDLALKKIVIITPTFATAVFLYLYMLRYHHSYNPFCITET